MSTENPTATDPGFEKLPDGTIVIGDAASRARRSSVRGVSDDRQPSQRHAELRSFAA